ncbi:mitochondrial import receptor subunit TOM40 homolog 1-like [Macrosteles quadrilineatus]|uniref:mitochondrial import receptor subunit TOM40 homolog 1-like n=1 Tax=Macrosteles quadrilineatus TaxID=74068 RepID=UPI0023E34A90|nr:mitochondrial import receptor subunit TOM40 homolog 1-like [Macrosteles quadrilineatus]
MYHLVGSRLKLRLDSQMEKGSFINSQLAAHYLADSSTSSLIVTNPDVLRNSGSMILQHLQNITPGLAIGMECAVMYNIARRKSMETTNLLSQLSLMGRYSTPLSAWSIILSKNNVLLNCYKKASEQIEFGMEINSNLRSTVFQTVGTLGFKVTLPDRGVILRGSVDTNTNVASVYQKRICNTPFAILNLFGI